MRLYLDTNVFAPFVFRRRDNLDRDTWELINDDANLLYVSPLCVHEFIFHVQRGRIAVGRDWKRGITLRQRLDELNIELVPITERHLFAEEALPIFDMGDERHRNPVDRLIVAQAISDRATLVSTDLKLHIYKECGLSLHQSRLHIEQPRDKDKR